MKLGYTNTASYVAQHSHGTHPKTLAVLHETVSPDVPGLKDILGVEAYLASKDYGIHGMTDLEGNIAHAKGFDVWIPERSTLMDMDRPHFFYGYQVQP